MKGSVAFLSIALALAATILLPGAGAQAATKGAQAPAQGAQAPASDARTGRTRITSCQQITNPGSYVVVNNLIATGDCLAISGPSHSFVTIDLGGFLIKGNGTGKGISTIEEGLGGIVVRNGSISSFSTGIEILDGTGGGSLVEGLRVFDFTDHGIALSSGIVRGNIVDASGATLGIRLDAGIATGNYVTGANGAPGIEVGTGLNEGNVVGP
jgi:hypothetical protein